MKRFVSCEDYDGTLNACSEDEDYNALINGPNVACWIWQFADSEDQAKEQHHLKQAEWEIDPTKETY